MLDKKVCVLCIDQMDNSGQTGLLAESVAIFCQGSRMTSVITGVISADDTVKSAHVNSVDFIRFQLQNSLKQFPPQIIKTGLLYKADIIRCVGEVLPSFNHPIIVDANCIDRRGNVILDDSAVLALKRFILPITDTLILNFPEAEKFSGIPITDNESIRQAGEILLNLGPKGVIFKGGHSANPGECIEWFQENDMPPKPFLHELISVSNPPGCSDILSSVYALGRANGHSKEASIIKAQAYLNLCLMHSTIINGKTIPDLTAPIRQTLPNFSETHAMERFGIYGSSPVLRKTAQTAEALAHSDLPVLITGETGTGKSLFARYIQAMSRRANKPFITVNCAAIPDNLLESTLFGHRKGAFTGAVSDQKGQFELANGGTIFLDEITELSVASQAKLLRLLEDGELLVLGRSVPVHVDVRVIAATNQDLRQLIEQKRFREDLFYRLHVGTIHLPPLRERKDDIPEIAQRALDAINHTLSDTHYFAPQVLKLFSQRLWPGNVRELKNIVERSARLAAHRLIDLEDIRFDEGEMEDASEHPQQSAELKPLKVFLAEAREAYLQKAIEQCDGNYSAAARLLEVTPQAVSRYMCAQKQIKKRERSKRPRK